MAHVDAFNDREGALHHSGAIIYALSAYIIGFTGLFDDSLWWNFISMILLGHGMTIAAYMVHECGHNTVFMRNEHNARLGTFLTWICGASYGTFEDIRFKHFRHHVDNDDVVWFDYERFFMERPRLLGIVKILEWFYIPAHDLVMHGLMIFTSFIIPERRDQRVRNVTVILVRGSLFLILCLYSIKAAFLYAIAYMLMMTILRFMDSLQHDYPNRVNLYTDEPSPHKGDLEWEQLHTFSDVISFRYVLPNWLVLNFGYHNAHHAKPTTPWFRLPALHRELYGDNPDRVITLLPQLKMFHQHRVSRILHDDPLIADVRGSSFLKAAQEARVDGGNAASFLTSF